MAKVKIEINNEAMRALRTGPEATAFAVGVAEKVAAAAGEGFVVQVSKSSRTRARVRVQTATFEARKAVGKDPTILTSALGAGRG